VARNQVIVHSKENAKKSSNNFPYDSSRKMLDGADPPD
jgi:hypothetical protein